MLNNATSVSVIEHTISTRTNANVAVAVLHQLLATL